MANRIRYLIAGALVVAAVVYLVVASTGRAARYFLTVEELDKMGQGALGRNLTVSGAILGQTIAYDSSVPRVTFTIVQVPGDPKEVERRGGLAQVLHDAVNDPSSPHLDVIYEGVKPDLLQGEAQAICRGRIAEDGRFYADEVLLKCPSRYAESLPNQVQR